MPSITLADIKAAADKKYGPLVIEGVPGGDVTLVNPLRLSKAKRKKLTDLDKKDEAGNEVDADVKLAEVIKLGAENAAAATRLLDAVGDDLTQLSEIVNHWTKSAQVGEASPSPS